MPSFENLPVAQFSRAEDLSQGKSPPRTALDLDLPPGRADRPRGAYVHVPFCFHKCHYCDFYSLVDRQDRQEAFVARLIREIIGSAAWLEAPLESIFVGGGTPTLLRADLWARLLQAIGDHGPLAPDLEFTVEANPETVTDELARILVAGGVNRISLGAQTFDPRHLRTLERHHDPDSVQRGVSVLREAGIGSINLDLIFGIPGQTPPEWESDLDAALALSPEHLSCYGLMYEPNTPLTERLRQGRISRADEADEAAMFEATARRLTAAGFEHYEISNFCRDGHACRHNLLYWRNESWWPLGPSAAGHAGGWRWKNMPRLGEYLSSGDSSDLPPITDVERLDADGRVGEVLMLGLRLRAGLPEATVEGLLEQGQRGRSRRAAIARHVEHGLLERSSGHLRLSDRGLLLADTVLADLV